MKRLFYLLLFLTGCARLVQEFGAPPVYQPVGPAHQIVAYFNDGSWEWGTCVAIGPNLCLTASHVVTHITANKAERPSFVTIDGLDADVWSYDPHDSKPALVFNPHGFSTFLPTASAVPGAGSVWTLQGDWRGTIDTDQHLVTPPVSGEVILVDGTIDVSSVNGQSGSPIMQSGAVVGILIGGYGAGTMFERPVP